MKKFNFKLEPVLKYRDHLENIARQEYVKAYMDVKDLEEQISLMEQQYTAMSDKIEQESVKGLPASLFHQYNDYLESIENDIKLKNKELVQLKNILSVKQQALTKKSVEKKVIERLKEKKREQYIEEFQSEEQKRADDMSSLKKAREVSESAS